MKPSEFLKYVQIDEYSATPKYMQLSDCVISAVEAGHLKKDDILPSINELSYILEISRDTAEKGYKYLKATGVIVSVPGKGYYIAQPSVKRNSRIFLLFNKLSTHKKIIYDTLVAELGHDAFIDFYIYNNDFSLFKKLIQNRKSDYSHYIIIPHFVEGGEKAYEIINTIPKEKLILLDKNIKGVTGDYAVIYEDFEKDIYNALYELKDELSKYHTLKMIFPNRSYYPKEILAGFKLFCRQYAFSYKILDQLSDEEIKKGEVFINLMEDDLASLLGHVQSFGLKTGEDVGIISYNETPWKKFLLNGITTISTDFKQMGELTAEVVKSGCCRQISVPFKVKLRSSI
jgi:DNA-binding transcriptional regulator YhcF (GntR family)